MFAKINALLAEMQNEMDDDVEKEDDGFELDDVVCSGGGRFDIELDAAFQAVDKRAEQSADAIASSRGVPVSASLPPSVLIVRNVSQRFGRVAALSDVSLEVHEGEFVALLGVNGAGKTTLFSLVTRLYDNVTGAIEVCGRDVRREPGPALAQLGVVFQSRSLDGDLSISQNLAYHASLHGMARSEARARMEALVAQVELGDRIDTRVSKLSGGQVRRAEIARALMHSPRLLLLDEPTVGLDVKSRREVVGLVRRLVADEGVGVLWATHLFDEIEPEDAVVVLHKGEVLARGAAHDIAGEQSLADAFLALTRIEEPL